MISALPQKVGANIELGESEGERASYNPGTDTIRINRETLDEAYSSLFHEGFLWAFKNMLDSIINALNNFLKTGSFNSAERAALEMEKDQAKAMRAMVLDAMDVAIENRDKAAGAQSESVESSDVRSSKRPKEQSKLKQDITAVMNGKYSEKYVSFGQTPAIYRNMLGVRNIPLMMTANHTYSVAVSEKKAKSDGKYRSNANYHNLGAETLSELPKALKNPAIILKSNNDAADSRFVSVVELYDKLNKPIIAAIEIEGSTTYKHNPESINIIVSAYGKESFENYIKKAVKENRVLYVNKTKSQQLYKGARVQYPRILLTANFDNNLASFKQVVNRKVDNSTRNSIKVEDSEGHELTEAQQVYFADTKVVDDNGNLLVVYHGSPSKFTVFDAERIGTRASAEGYGFYFTDSQEKAEGYHEKDGNVMKGYLNIKNPLSLDEVTIKKSEVKKLLEILDPTGDDILSSYDASGIGYPSRTWYNNAMRDTLDVIMENENDSDIIAEIANTYGSMVVLSEVRKNLGYDGYMALDKYANGKVYVAFESNQFKNFDNENPTDNEDVRYSIKVTDARNSFKEYGEASPYTDSLAEVEVVSTILSKANQALGGIKSVKESSLNRISRSVIKKYKSNVEVEELSKNIFQAFSQMAENKLENNYESVMDYMLNIGDEVIANSQLKDPDSERVYNETRKNLKSYNIKLTETDKEELKNAYGTFIKGMGTLKKHGINLYKDGHLSRYSLT